MPAVVAPLQRGRANEQMCGICDSTYAFCLFQDLIHISRRIIFSTADEEKLLNQNTSFAWAGMKSRHNRTMLHPISSPRAETPQRLPDPGAELRCSPPPSPLQWRGNPSFSHLARVFFLSPLHPLLDSKSLSTAM